jgi:hypothetical protein
MVKTRPGFLLYSPDILNFEIHTDNSIKPNINKQPSASLVPDPTDRFVDVTIWLGQSIAAGLYFLV